jgi:hypothetical protein
MQWKKNPFKKNKMWWFSRKNEIRIVWQNVLFYFYFYVSYSGEILFQENVVPNMHFVLVANTCTMAIKKTNIMAWMGWGFFFFFHFAQKKKNLIFLLRSFFNWPQKLVTSFFSLFLLANFHHFAQIVFLEL